MTWTTSGDYAIFICDNSACRRRFLIETKQAEKRYPAAKYPYQATQFAALECGGAFIQSSTGGNEFFCDKCVMRPPWEELDEPDVAALPPSGESAQQRNTRQLIFADEERPAPSDEDVP